METPTKIALWQTAFLGDAVLTLPLVKAVNQVWPQAEVHYFVRGGVESLFSAQTGITSVTGFYKRSKQKGLNTAWSYGRELSGQGFDLFLSAHRSFRTALVARASRIPLRVGYDTPWFNRLAYTRTIDRRFDALDEIERLMRLLLPLGVDIPAPWADITLPAEAEEQAETFFTGLASPVLGMHPGSTWPTKKWPEENFAAVAARAANEGATVLIFGGPGEESVAARVADMAGASGKIIDLSAKLNLPTLAAYLKRLNAYLTNDSGPMHLAWMQCTPVVALFGPTVRELGFFPRGETATVLQTDIPCRPCGLHGPRRCPEGHHRCMSELTPDMAWKALFVHF